MSIKIKIANYGPLHDAPRSGHKWSHDELTLITFGLANGLRFEVIAYLLGRKLSPLMATYSEQIGVIRSIVEPPAYLKNYTLADTQKSTFFGQLKSQTYKDLLKRAGNLEGLEAFKAVLPDSCRFAGRAELELLGPEPAYVYKFADWVAEFCMLTTITGRVVQAMPAAPIIGNRPAIRRLDNTFLVKPAIPKEPEMQIRIETITFINGKNVSEVSKDEMLQLLLHAKTEHDTMLKQLQELGDKPEYLKTKISKLAHNMALLSDLIDGK